MGISGWGLRVSPSETVVVLDYRGAPYLRFSRSGVQVNRNSEMFYPNQTPVGSPPSSLRARLHALAVAPAVIMAPLTRCHAGGVARSGGTRLALAG